MVAQKLRVFFNWKLEKQKPQSFFFHSALILIELLCDLGAFVWYLIFYYIFDLLSYNLCYELLFTKALLNAHILLSTTTTNK